MGLALFPASWPEVTREPGRLARALAVGRRQSAKDHVSGTKRPPGEKDHYEGFNHDHVQLVDLRETPISRITPAGMETTNGGSSQLQELDVIIYATGLRAVTGELIRMDIVGKHGFSLQEKWAHGPKTNFGVQFAGFPNFFAILGSAGPIGQRKPVPFRLAWQAPRIRRSDPSPGSSCRGQESLPARRTSGRLTERAGPCEPAVFIAFQAAQREQQERDGERIAAEPPQHGSASAEAMPPSSRRVLIWPMVNGPSASPTKVTTSR